MAVRRLTHQFDVLADQTGADLSRRTRIVIVNNNPSSLFVFRISPKKFWRTIQNWPCNVAQVELSLHDQSCQRNRRPYASKSFSFTNNFRWIWLVFEGPHGGLLFCFGLIRIDPWCSSCNDLINVFWSAIIVFCQHFFTTIDTNLFLSENLSFLRPVVHAISNVCWRKKCPRMPLSQGM